MRHDREIIKNDDDSSADDDSDGLFSRSDSV